MPTDPAPAQITYVSNAFLSPQFLGGLATAIALEAGRLGVHVLDDQASQQMLVAFLGIAGTAFFHWLFPGASGKLGITAPAPWSTPAPADVQAGASVVTVAAPTDVRQATVVEPLQTGKSSVVAVSTPMQVGDTVPAGITVTSMPR